MTNKIIFFLMLIILSSQVAFALGKKENIIYVDVTNETNDVDGSSWNKAYNNLNDALNSAEFGDEIWVSKGVYIPSNSNREISFEMKDGVSLYGGFIGNESKRESRNWLKNITILSGEIGNPNKIEDNTKTVVKAANNILDGFTISGGYGLGNTQGNTNQGEPARVKQIGSNSVGHSSPNAILSSGGKPGTGAGIQIWQVSPVISNCTITDNYSGKAGGIYIVGSVMMGPNKKQNKTKVEDKKLPTFINCFISDNTAVMRGGGVSIDMGGSAWFIDTIFSDNSCTLGKGGAIYNDFGCSPYLINTLFINNFAQSGGAIGNDGESNPVIYQSTFYNNSASEAGGALYQGTGPSNMPTVVNSIIWGNESVSDEASIYNWNDSYATVSYSLVEGGYTGSSILDIDPEFSNPNNNDFSYDSSSVLTTAGINSDKIGYDSELSVNRDLEEVDQIKTYVHELKEIQTTIPLNLDNSSIFNSELEDVSILYVSQDSKGSGLSWSDSSGSIQEMIDQASHIYEKTGKKVQIWISSGVYLPGDNRKDSFILRSGVEIYGGFTGNELNFSERDFKSNKTILSGDIGVVNESSDNSYHVVIGANNTIVDGLHITGGNANGTNGEIYDNKGGAVLNYRAGNIVRPNADLIGFSLTFKNIQFYDNYAQEGGAVYTYHGGNPVFDTCVFNNNTAEYGAATVDRAGVNSKYINSSFTNNYASYKGGAIFVDYGSMATIEDSNFNSNSAGTNGGAVYVVDRASQMIPNKTDIHLIDNSWKLPTDIFSSVYVKNSKFINNSANIDGGAFYIYENSNLKLVASDFINNYAYRNGDSIALVNGSSLYLDDNVLLNNSDVYSDKSSIIK